MIAIGTKISIAKSMNIPEEDAILEQSQLLEAAQKTAATSGMQSHEPRDAEPWSDLPFFPNVRYGVLEIFKR